MDKKEKKSTYDKEYYLKNKERKIAASIKWAKKNKKRLGERLKEWRKTSPVYKEYYKKNNKNQNLKWNYGITIDDYNILFKLQEGKCKICERHQSEFKKALHVDHCHKTEKVRGLLCSSCNRGIGYFKEDTNILNKAVSYIQDNL